MLHPDDDIEDVYRQFAEHYPLKAGDSGWDELEAKLYGSNTGGAQMQKPATGNAFIKRYSYLVAALLLLVAGAFGVYEYKAGKKLLPESSVNNDKGIQKPEVPGTALQSNAMGDDAVNHTGKREENSSSPVNANTGGNSMPLTGGKTLKIKSKDAIRVGNAGISVNGAFPVTEVANRTRALMEGGKQPEEIVPGAERDNTVPVLQVKNLLQNSNTAARQGLHNELPAIETSAGKKIAPVAPNAFKKRFYISVLAGPDVSMVKFQGGSNVGVSGGILGGIKLSKGFSLEAGLLLERKNYFSAGKYFNKTTIGMTDPGEEVSSVNGESHFVEVPIIARFSLANKRHGNFFAAAGLSSYITQRERYDVEVNRPAGQERRDTDDDTWLVNPFSVMHLSAGYSYNINARSSLQAEPYLKLPLYGIGRGLLPITSTGVYIKYTYAIGK